MANKIPLAYADVELQLSTAISVGDTTFSLSSATDDDGNALPAGKYCFTIDNGSTNKEYLIGQLNGTNVTSVVSVSRQGVETSGAARAHRIGASAIISDFATIQRVADILRGQETLDGSNPVSYDAEPTLANRVELATVAYVLDNVSGGTVNFDNQVITGAVAGETVAAGDLVYLKESDSEWYQCDADTATTVENVQLGIAKGSGSDGVAITGGVQISGVYTTSGLTANSLYYASNTAGEYATTAGTTKQIVGFAYSTTKLLMVPRTRSTVTTREKDALAGTSGTPSVDNKFVTDEDYRLGVQSMTAGATISGATLPVPVYQNASDNEVYACDADDTAAMKFIGFAVSDGTDASSIDVKFTGVVPGFSGLTEGSRYYVQDTAGTIGTSPGTYEVLVGVAISETELLIQKGNRRQCGVQTISSSGVDEDTTEYAVTLGFRPSVIRVHAVDPDFDNASFSLSSSFGVWTNGTYAGHYISINSGNGIIAAVNSYIAQIYSPTNTEYWQVTITSVTDTGFTFSARQKVTSPPSVSLAWEAEGDI